jgi:hypothetical protein
MRIIDSSWIHRWLVMMAGHPSALAYAEQIVNVEGLRLEGSFADAVRGLHLYGAKVLDGARLFDLQANP